MGFRPGFMPAGLRASLARRPGLLPPSSASSNVTSRAANHCGEPEGGALQIDAACQALRNEGRRPAQANNG
jgi:hypothetical protein